MSDGDPRVVFFAYGPVGREVVQFALDHDPGRVAAVVALPGDAPVAALLARPSLSARAVEFDPGRPDVAAGKIRALQPDVAILAWWPHILKGELLDLGQRLMLNLHPSLLPHGRGKDPNFWAIVESRPFGVTIHHVDAGIDAGDIAFQREIPHGWEDTGKTLYDKATAAIVDLFRESYPRILAFDVPRIAQDHAVGTFHTRRELDPRSLIELDSPCTPREVLNLLRARTFEPFPGCRFVDGDTTYEARVSITKVRRG
jgi:methionyl-tRNA formyltransferase